MTDNQSVERTHTAQGIVRGVGRWANSLTARTLLVAVLGLLMMVPLGMVESTVHERDWSYRSVLDDIASRWGDRQQLTGPMIAVPYTDTVVTQERIRNDNGDVRVIDRKKEVQGVAYLLPDRLVVKTSLDDDVRHRGIYSARVYQATLSLTADYDSLSLRDIADADTVVHWQRAWVSVGLSDMGAINGIEEFTVNNQDLNLESGTRLEELPSGFHGRLSLTEDTRDAEVIEGKSLKLGLAMSFNGSESFNVVPLAETTEIEIESTWPHPSFVGDVLPFERDITDAGFSARWSVPHLARDYAQRFTAENVPYFEQFHAGVELFEPVTLYSQITRAIKYGILFIAVTFMALLVFERALGIRLHVLQYALVGVALSVFFLILLSVSEHLGFLKAYAAGAALTILLISSYVRAAVGNWSRAFIMGLILSALYGVLFVLLRLEDHALLVGTALVFSLLAVLMFLTRHTATQIASHTDTASPHAPATAEA